MERYQASARFDYAAPPCRRINVLANKPTSTAWTNCANPRCSVSAGSVSSSSVVSPRWSSPANRRPGRGLVGRRREKDGFGDNNLRQRVDDRPDDFDPSYNRGARFGAPQGGSGQGRLPQPQRLVPALHPLRRGAAHVHQPRQGLHGKHGHRRRDDHDQAVGLAKPDDREQLRVPGRLPLLRRDSVPPCLYCVHKPRRRPDRDG